MCKYIERKYYPCSCQPQRQDIHKRMQMGLALSAKPSKLNAASETVMRLSILRMCTLKGIHNCYSMALEWQSLDLRLIRRDKERVDFMKELANGARIFEYLNSSPGHCGTYDQVYVCECLIDCA